MVASDSSVRVSLAELVATLSLVADLGMGRPVERVLRQTVIAMRLGAVAGLDQATRASAYYTSLLTWVGCAAETSEVVVRPWSQFRPLEPGGQPAGHETTCPELS